jgi:hypothetical protein
MGVHGRRRRIGSVLTIGVAAAWIGAFTSAAAEAAPITFSGSSGSLAASVTFATSGTDLLVTLTNASAADVLVPADVLTAVFFDSSTPLTLTRTSAVLAGGSAVFFGPSDPGGVVGGEWAYLGNVAAVSQDYGIGSAGLGVFGPGDVFPGSNLQGPASPNGLQYGLTSAGDNLAAGNAAVTGCFALIRNSVVFTLSGLPAGFEPSAAIASVRFQYGTALSEPSFGGGSSTQSVPEPLSVMLVGSGLAGVANRVRRRYKARSASQRSAVGCQL